MEVIQSLIFRGLDMPTVTFLFAVPTRPGHVRPAGLFLGRGAGRSASETASEIPRRRSQAASHGETATSGPGPGPGLAMGI
jgi:hypothetical protein